MDCRATHPAGIPPENLWFGREVEGKLRGVRTAFIAHALTESQEDLLKAHEDLGQLFFTETFRKPEDFEWLDSIFTWAMSEELVLTIGVMHHEAESIMQHRALKYPEMGVIVRFFEAPWIKLLQGFDQISVGVPYRMITYPAAEGVSTIPQDYEKDTTT